MLASVAMKPTFFKTPAAWRRWLERHHADTPELLVGFYKVGSGRPSITWPESVDGALCFGWIDGVRRSLGEETYTIRFTPRRTRSIWSAVNLRRYRALEAAGLVHAAGRRVFESRDAKRAVLYSYEQEKHALSAAFERRFRANRKAWGFWISCPPWYRRTASHWVSSAKREETRERRFATLLGDCEAGRNIKQLQRTAKK